MRTLRPRLIGLLSCLLILAIVTGLPIVLFAVGANPFTIATSLPSPHRIITTLLAPDDGRVFVAGIKIVAWLAWAVLSGLILIEIVAAVRGIQAPHLPGLRLPQHAARTLVSAALLLFVSLPVTVANAAPTTPPVATATQTPGSGHSAPSHPAPGQHATPTSKTRSDPKSSAAADSTRTIKHTVRPGESLWSIAQDKLGDGRKYRELVASNADLLDGKPGFIKPGWVLTIELPHDPQGRSTGHGTVIVEKGDTLSSIAAEELGDPDRYPEIFRASRNIKQPHGAHLTDPDEIDVGWTLKIPSLPNADHQMADKTEKSTPSAPSRRSAPTERSAPSPNAQATPRSDPTSDTAGTETTGPADQTAERSQPTAAAAPAEPDDHHLQEEPAWLARTAYGVGALLAAGVIVLIARRRSTQQRRRRPGQKMPLPTGKPAEVEQELRATADALSVETVDTALRTLARDCAETSTPLPKVRAARLTATQFDLYLSEPASLPSPWAGTSDTTVWSLPVDNTEQLDHLDVSGVPAPYPSLVTIGHDDEDGHVLLDLEHLGSLGVVGPPSDTTEVFAAIAIELATSVWADDVQVTLVGAFPDLEDTLQTGRIRYLPSVGRLLDDLEHRAAVDRKAFAVAGVKDLHEARVTNSAPDSWMPEIVLVSGALTERQRIQIHRLVDDLPRVALAFVTSESELGEWSLQLTADPDRAVLSPVDLQLRPQRVPADQYADLLQVAALADLEELSGSPVSEPSLAEVAAIRHVHEPPGAADGLAGNAGPRPRATDVATTDLDFVTVQTDPTQTGGTLTSDDGPDTIPAADAPPQSGTPDTAQPSQLPTPITGRHPETSPTRPPEESAPGSPDPALPPIAGDVEPLRLPAPRINVLGPIEMINITGKVEPSKRARLLEFAAYLALNPGASHIAIDDAIWPDRKTEDNLNTRNPATSKLRRWVGTDPDGQEYLPRHQAGEGYAFAPDVTTDAGEWDDLLQGQPLRATTESLEAALHLVRGIPFESTHPRRYAWAELIKQRLISEIVDAAYELGRRRLMSGRWRSAEEALVIGLRIEPAQENLWRLRILAAHESHNPVAETEAIERLLTITEQLECELEPETEQLIAALKKPGSDLDQFLATAL